MKRVTLKAGRRLAETRRRLISALRDERGQGGLIAVLALLVLGGLTIPPVLDLVGVSLLGEEVHEQSLREFYAADAGIEDALWQIKADELSTLFPDYDRYEFSTAGSNEYRYLDYPASAFPPDMNGKEVDVSIENVWVPPGDDIPMPSPAQAQQVVDDAKMVVTGTAVDANTYRIRITYNYQDITDPDWDDLKLDKVAVWLPPGFTYVPDSSNLEDNPFDDYYCVPTTQAYKSGELVEWDFDPNVDFIDMPDVDTYSYPLITTVELDFDGPSGILPQAALAWATTTGVSDNIYAWDADVRVFRLTSTATDAQEGTHTTIEAYTARSEIRRLTSAIAGDYYATGSSLIDYAYPQYNDRFRNRLHKESDATVSTDNTGENGVPTQAIPEAVYLYWTGWIDWHGYDPTGDETTIFFDPCTRSYWGGYNFDYWNAGSLWGYANETAFLARGGGGSGAYLTLKNPLDLSSYSDQNVTVSWRVWEYGSLESDDCFGVQFSGNGGTTWGDADGDIGSWETVFCDDSTFGSTPGTGRRFSYQIPAAYVTSQFRVRFYTGFSSYYDAICFDEFTVTASEDSSGGSLVYPDNPTAENLTALIEDTARTNVVMFEAGGSSPAEITADTWEIEPTTGSDWEGTWSYCCFADITDQVRDWIDDGYLNNNSSGTYTLGHKVAENEVDSGYSYDLYVPGGPNEETGYPLGTPAVSTSTRYQYSHCGWSVVVIYTSPDTEGHQLYLFDIQDPEFDFTEAWGPGGNPNPDFDGDGEGGGRISGFLVPQRIEGEEIAAKMTVFVGEGDSLISGDEVEVNGTNMSNAASPWSNVWNSESPGLSVTGVDIDTFVIDWDDNILEPGDSSAEIDLPTWSDGFNLVYIILSFRSEVTTGGTISFLLSG
jgi:hypothetical protein